MGWTEERVALLKKLWAEGHSASQIAKQVGGVTRNAVIGKVHRLGLAGRATPSRPAKRPARPRQQRSQLPMAPRVRPHSIYAPPVLTVVLDPLRFEDGSVATVLTLKEGMCKFPIGDPTDAAFAFCGRTACMGPYCGDHARLAYQPSQARRRRADGQSDELRRLTRQAAL